VLVQKLGLVKRFVSVRFLLAPIFVAVYYLQLKLPPRFHVAKHVCLMLLIGTLLFAIVANLQWIRDYKSRLLGGVNFLNGSSGTFPDKHEVLSQIRWANAKMLGLVAMILAFLLNYEKLELVPLPHRVPVIVVGLLVLVALFDAALDLEAE